ncbi:MAG: arginase [Candidatus Paracaedibacteraceae bacterium]|nr:arginase [Candidatus Paracaedibacteraceae bacterium]
MKNKIALIGIGSGWGAPDQRTAKGPSVVIEFLKEKHPSIKYTLDYFHDDDLLPSMAIKPFDDHELRCQKLKFVFDCLTSRVKTAISDGYFPIVIGGDHSLAIGTWIGVSDALNQKDFSLLWFDAHMDAHTIETSESMAPHGMPVSALLGFGYDEWTKKNKNTHAIIKPENLYQFGIRSYEVGEAALLSQNKVHIDYVEDCKAKGLSVCMQNIMSQLKTPLYGISIDIDAFDPEFAPGTGTVEPNGLDPNDLLAFLADAGNNKRCILVEIMEFNPEKDVNNKTLSWISRFIEVLMGKNEEVMNDVK